MGGETATRISRAAGALACWLLLGGAAAAPAAAQSPVLCDAPEARQFDFWIGEWDVVNRQRRPPPAQGEPAGPWGVTGRATDRVHAVVGGCGIVEHWRGEAHLPQVLGFSVRAFEPETGRWRLVLLWPNPGPASTFELEGAFRHGRGEFFREAVRPAGDTAMVRFTFSDASADALRWDAATSLDGGWTWAPTWIMEFTRRDPVADGGLANGPTASTARCPGGEHRAFDRWLGDWEGTRVEAGADTVAVRARLYPILDGCAVVERVTGEGWEAFRFRAWDAAAAEWVEYELAADRLRLVRRTARAPRPETAGGDVLVDFTEAAGPGGERRTRWERAPGGALRWRVEERSAGEGWRPVSLVELRPIPGGGAG